MIRKVQIVYMVVGLFFCGSLYAQTPSPSIYPTNWFTGMKWNKVQLMLHREEGFIFPDKLAVNVAYPGVTIAKVTKTDNKNYLFVDIIISPAAKPGIVTFNFNPAALNEKFTAKFELKARRPGNGTQYAQGLSSADFIYLIMPDRFANGDDQNDRIAGMQDQSLNRDTLYDRHGGDMQGITQHIGYLKDLGVTAVWMTPVIENDMPNRTEHGYAFTNHYRIDPRLGGATAYKQLSEELHKKGMKLVQDAVYNHVGSEHFFFKDKPMPDWFNEWPHYTNTTYKDQPLMDSHASSYDKQHMSNGWFTRQMPDLNQNNPFVANFLIQHAIWCTEEFGVDAWRIDTYIYNDLAFMNRCNKALLDEFPKMYMFGETWVHGVLNQAYFTGNKINVPFKSNLPGVTDFQTNLYGIGNALNEPFGWTNGVNKLYSTLANDFVYEDAMKQVIFLDNHDLSRFYSVVKEDTAKYKMALAWLLTCRGIPQTYYGDEHLLTGETHPNDGFVRKDFKGGWKEDAAEDKFTEKGRTPAENSIFNWFRNLAKFRLQSSAIKTGSMMQYVPEDGVYVYFRYDDKQTVMCVMNTSNKAISLDLNRFKERVKGATSGFEPATGKTIPIRESIGVDAHYMLVMEIR